MPLTRNFVESSRNFCNIFIYDAAYLRSDNYRISQFIASDILRKPVEITTDLTNKVLIGLKYYKTRFKTLQVMAIHFAITSTRFSNFLIILCSLWSRMRNNC